MESLDNLHSQQNLPIFTPAYLVPQINPDWFGEPSQQTIVDFGIGSTNYSLIEISSAKDSNNQPIRFLQFPFCDLVLVQITEKHPGSILARIPNGASWRFRSGTDLRVPEINSGVIKEEFYHVHQICTSVVKPQAVKKLKFMKALMLGNRIFARS